MYQVSEDELTKKLKKKMAICTILQRKFGCKCASPFREGIAEVDYQPYCEVVAELYKECFITK